MKYIDRGWRFIGTSLLWFFFGLVGLVVSFLVLPIVCVFVKNPARHRRLTRSIIGQSFGLFVRSGCLLGLFEVRISGREYYAPDRAQLILANHPTLIDVVILISVFPQVDCVIKEAVMRNLFMGATVTAANYISNREPTDLLGSCVERLRAGAHLLLFPEGTRTERGGPVALKPGAAEVALRARCDILPIAIVCRPPFLTKADPWYWIPETRPVFSIKMLPPIPVSDLTAGDLCGRDARHELNQSLTALFEAEIS